MRTQRFSFVATKVGTYVLVCGVPGHEIQGMWDVLKVTRGGMPRLTLKGRAHRVAASRVSS